MRDGYVGDIGDFSKYGLLRFFFGKPEIPGSMCESLRLGIIWYFNQPTEKKEGNWTPRKYPELQHLDQFLYQQLYEMVDSQGARRVGAVEENRILPTDTFYRLPVTNLSKQDRRNWWMYYAIKGMKEADFVFVDPDNGIATEIMHCQDARKRPTTKRTAEHAYLDELERISKRGKSLIIFEDVGQGLRKGEKADDRIRTISDLLVERLNPVGPPWAFRWHPKSARAYFLVAQTLEHRDWVKGVLSVFRRSPWVQQEHFCEVEISTCPPSS